MLRVVIATDQPSRLERTLGAAALLLVVACAVWFYAQRAVIDAAAPSSPQFDAAERILTVEVKPGDAFAMLPSPKSPVSPNKTEPWL